MNDEIREVINKHLPAQVGEALKTRLLVAEQNEQRLKDALSAIESLKAENACLNKNRIEAGKLAQDQAKLREDQQKLAIDTAVLAVRSDMVSRMLEQNHAIVLAVFANNRLKYTETRSDGHAFPGVPTPGNAYPCPQTTQTSSTRTVESEGSPA